jgi:hypothetical protein
VPEAPPQQPTSCIIARASWRVCPDH